MNLAIEARYHALRSRALAAASVEAGLRGRGVEADRCANEHAEARLLADALNAVAGTDYPAL